MKLKFWKRKPLSFEDQVAQEVREKTENYETKEARFVSHTVYPVYKAGQKPTTFTVYHGAHA